MRSSFPPRSATPVRSEVNGCAIRGVMTALTTVMTGSGFAYSVGFVLCAAFVLNAWRQHRLRDGLPLPPGPIGLPVVGSVFDVNPAHPWLSYERWGKRYGTFESCSSANARSPPVSSLPGDIVYANLLGKDFIIINSAKVAHDLLDRRSTIYSGRPHIPENKTCVALFSVVANRGQDSDRYAHPALA